ncbi:DUF1552 domain-containing protein [Lentisphaera profundi]|uniref:DUF1552 domain-containing protein n=1 Tax=Lentisphaera profundi TaxID=1658616 RepID=A0ABY7W1V0_9BACT|nr:DUF1552 domain-containing protein [Lentisphaera profundi]WDE98949.1 DUF1552 domain-containing protein [Lentisphaera profundi]
MSLHLYNRRTMLKAGFTALALPFMESLAMGKSASTVAPKRFLFIGCGYGFSKKNFFPTKAGKFSKIGLTPGLKPLERHKDDITMVSNLTNLGARNPHAGSTTYLTGADVGGTRGRKFINGISLDQVIAQKIGQDTRFASLSLSGEGEGNDGHGPGLSLSWSDKGHPIPGIKNPLALYHELFGQSKESNAEREYRLSQKRSILDAVVADLKYSRKKLSKTDQDKLEDYLQSIRQIEQTISREVQWADTAKAKAPLQKPGATMDGLQSLMTLQRLMIAAFQTDSTRVITYRQPVSPLLASWEINVGAHTLSHQNHSHQGASNLKDFKSMELFSGLIDLFKNTPDLNGKSLFDSTLISYGTNIRLTHSLRGCPAIYTGGAAAKLKTGEHIILPEEDTPLANYWLTLCQQSGVEMDSFSHSTGTLKKLIRS